MTTTAKRVLAGAGIAVVFILGMTVMPDPAGTPVDHATYNQMVDREPVAADVDW